MMSSKENFDDLKASFDDDLEQLNQEFDQLLLKKLSLEHALEQDQLFDELAQEDEQIDKLAANRPDLDAAIKDQLERCQKKRLQKHTLQSLKKVSRRAAAFLVVFLAGFTVLFFTVDAVKLNVVEFIVRSHEMFTQFRIVFLICFINKSRFTYSTISTSYFKVFSRTIRAVIHVISITHFLSQTMRIPTSRTSRQLVYYHYINSF